jgi:hypothetical protein
MPYSSPARTATWRRNASFRRFGSAVAAQNAAAVTFAVSRLFRIPRVCRHGNNHEQNKKAPVTKIYRVTNTHAEPKVSPPPGKPAGDFCYTATKKARRPPPGFYNGNVEVLSLAQSSVF